MRGPRLRAFFILAALLAGACSDDPSPEPPRAQPAPVKPQPAPPKAERRRGEDVADAAASVELGRVEGVVVAGETPVADFPVHLLFAFTADDIALGETKTAADGTFAFDGVPAGTVRLVAAGAHDGTEKRVQEKVTVEPRGVAKSRLQLRAAPAAEPEPRSSDRGASVLRVVDAETGAPLAGARAYAPLRLRDTDEPYFDGGHRIPGTRTSAQTPRVADSDGRVALGEGRGTSQWYVVADGHEWFGVEAAHGAGTTEVRLRPAGRLRLSIPRWAELEAANVDTDVGSPGRTKLPRPDEKGDLLVEGLLPGLHTIVVRRGEWYEDGIEYGHGRVQIVAGGEAQLTIAIGEVQRRTKVNVTGTVNVPESWGAWPLRVKFEGADASNSDFDGSSRLVKPVSGRTMTFELKDVPEGTYRLEFDPFQWRAIVTVAAGAPPLQFDLGEPAVISVKVLNDADGKSLSDASVTWHTRLDEQHGYSSENSRERSADGSFVLRVPGGTVYLEGRGPHFVQAEQTLEAKSGAVAEATIRLKAGGMLVVRVRSADSSFAAPSPDIEITPVSVAGCPWSMMSTSARGGGADFDSLAPGVYSVSADEDDMPGWTCKPESVEVRAGETKTVELKLEKKP